MNTKLVRIVSLITLMFVTVTAIATQSCKPETTVVIIYDTKNGHTRTMAFAVAKGASYVTNTKVVVESVQKAKVSDVISADAIILGSPVYNANVSPAMQQFINKWPMQNAVGQSIFLNKIGAAFVTAGGISEGQELVMLNLLHTMLVFGMIPVGGDQCTSAFGAAAITGEAPFDQKGSAVNPQFLAKAQQLGKRVAILTQKLKAGECVMQQSQQAM